MRFRIYALTAFLLFAVATACKEENEVLVAADDVVTISGTEYKTVTIGALTWTAMNHAGDGGQKYDQANSKPEYGKYYTYEEVKSIVLPAGWRIPTMEDYKALAAAQNITIPSYGTHTDGIKTITSTTDWLHTPGNNSSGFNAYPAGYSYNNFDPINGDIAEFWTAEGSTMSIQEGANQTTLRTLFYGGNSDQGYRFNIRFVQD